MFSGGMNFPKLAVKACSAEERRRDEARDIGAELLQSVREAKQMLFPEGFPCGWDERDAKV